MNIKEISLSEIKPDPDQPRKTFDAEAMERLTQSIRDNGIEQPIIVRKNGAGYVIIDGERRWRAAKEAGLREIPSIIGTSEDILEKQLRSDCLKEELKVDELDKAIYRYFNVLKEFLKDETSYLFKEYLKYCDNTNRRKNETETKNSKYGFIGYKIGKSDLRVRIAIDRHEFKDKRPEINELQKKENEQGYDFLNSTIALTSAIDDNDVRAAVVEIAVDYKSDSSVTNEDVKEIVKEIVADGITDTSEIDGMFHFKSEAREQKRKQNKPKPKKEKKARPDKHKHDANRAITQTTKSIHIVCNGSEELFKLWSYIDEDLKEEYIQASKRFVSILKKNLKNNYKQIGV